MKKAAIALLLLSVAMLSGAERPYFNAALQAGALGKWVAVGMPVARHPPHRSVRAQLAHIMRRAS